MPSLVLLIWLTLQWVGLALAAARVPLAAEYPQPAEFHAVQMLLVIQFTTSAILSPILCKGWKISLGAVASGWVMLLAAAFLAGWASWTILPAGALIGLWLAGLWLWMGAAPPARWKGIVASAASCYAAGGVLLWYLRLDLNPGATPGTTVAFGPLALALASPQIPAPSAWWGVAIVGLGGLLARLLLWWRMGPHPLNTDPVMPPRA